MTLIEFLNQLLQTFTNKDKELLFKKFSRLSAQPTRGEHTTGLGLSIVKKLMEVMGGEVWCESEEGHGASFFISFPKFNNEV